MKTQQIKIHLKWNYGSIDNRLYYSNSIYYINKSLYLIISHRLEYIT